MTKKLTSLLPFIFPSNEAKEKRKRYNTEQEIKIQIQDLVWISFSFSFFLWPNLEYPGLFFFCFFPFLESHLLAFVISKMSVVYDIVTQTHSWNSVFRFLIYFFYFQKFLFHVWWSRSTITIFNIGTGFHLIRLLPPFVQIQVQRFEDDEKKNQYLHTLIICLGADFELAYVCNTWMWFHCFYLIQSVLCCWSIKKKKK